MILLRALRSLGGEYAIGVLIKMDARKKIEVILEENRTNQTTVVLVTHNIFQAKRISHRTALLLGGKLIEIQDTESFFNQPINDETKAFIRGELVY